MTCKWIKIGNLKNLAERIKLRNSVPFLCALDVSYFRGIFPSHAIHPVSHFRIYFQTCTWGIRHYHKILTYDYSWEAEGIFASNIYVRAFAMHVLHEAIAWDSVWGPLYDQSKWTVQTTFLYIMDPICFILIWLGWFDGLSVCFGIILWVVDWRVISITFT